MSKTTITCMMCGEEVHSIELHLNRDHGPDADRPCTFDEYKGTFPNEPVLSAMAKERIAKHKAEREAVAPTAKPVVKLDGQRASFSDLFRLGDHPESKSKTGKDIMVRVLPDGEHSHMVPKYNDGYVYDMDNLKSLVMAFEMDKTSFAFGHSGLGKTSIYKQICSATNRPFVRIQHTSETQYSHIVGQWTVKHTIDANGNAVSFTEWQWGPLALAMKNGWTYNADEFDRCPPAVLSVYQAVLEGEPLYVEEAPPAERLVVPSPDFRFVGTGNTNGTGDATGLYQATMQMDAATMERFAIVVEFTYMGANEEQAMLIAGTNVSKEHAAKLVSYANTVRERFPEDFDLTIGPRVLLNMADLGIARGSFTKGIELAFANRLPPDQKKSAMDVAQRIFAD